MVSRVWIFTVNADASGNLPELNLDVQDVRFATWQREAAPTTGRHHWQGCLKLRRPMRLPAVKRLLGGDRAHVEIARDWEAAKKYCGKDETRVGPGGQVGEDIAQGHRSDLDGAIDRLRAGAPLRAIADEQPRTYLKYHKGFEALKMAFDKPVPIERTTIVLIGATGVGKTRFIYDNFPIDEVYNVFDIRTPWFCGYAGEKVALLDECNVGMMDVNFFKQLSDRYPIRVPVKGGSAAWKTELLFCTSNRAISEWWPNISQHDLDAVYRRVNIFYLPHDLQKLKDFMETRALPRTVPLAPSLDVLPAAAAAAPAAQPLLRPMGLLDIPGPDVFEVEDSSSSSSSEDEESVDSEGNLEDLVDPDFQ